MRSRVPVILVIDLEPDAFLLSKENPSLWSGCHAAFALVDEFRALVSAQGHASVGFTWALRMDPQIAQTYGVADHVVKLFGRQLERAQARGDEIGLHTHFFRWNPETDRWRVDHANRAWVAHCLRESFVAFGRAFSRQCTTYRSGDRWHDNASVNLVEELGARYDLTPEVGQAAVATLQPEAEFTGSLPDYVGVPPHPYRPSLADFRKAEPTGNRSLWMIPLAGGARGVQPSWRASWKRTLVGLADPFKVMRSAYAPYICRLTSMPTIFRERFDAYCAEPGMAHAAFAVRSDDFACASERNNVAENLKYLMRRLSGRGFEFCTPARAMEILSRETSDA